MQDNPPLPYLERIRNYYQILGYGASYEWAQHDDVPFASPQKPLSEMRIGIDLKEFWRAIIGRTRPLIAFVGLKWCRRGDNADAHFR